MMALVLIFILILSIVMTGDARAIDDARARKIREEKAFKKDVCQLLQKMIRIDKNTSINPDAPFTGTSMYSLDIEIDYRIFYKKHCEVDEPNPLYDLLLQILIICSTLYFTLYFLGLGIKHNWTWSLS